MKKEYDKYKESELVGIDNVPSHWHLIKLKFIGSLYSGLTGKKGDDFYNEDNSKSRPYINFKNIANNLKINPSEYDLVVIEKNEIQNEVKKGDLFFLMSSENFDDIGKTSVLVDDLDNTYLNSFCRGFRINDDNFDPIFLNYLLLSQSYRQILSNEAKGFTRINIQVGKVLNFKIYAPFNKHEQIQISSYLDSKTSIIDMVINKKEKLIDLLKEQRQSIIDETVTKGLNPNAIMKDSGIISFGKIPEQWSITKLKFLSKIKGRIGYRGYTTDDLVEEGEGALALGATHITWEGDIDLSKPVFINWVKYEESPEIKLEKGDIIIVQRGSTCGKVALISDEIGPATINPSLVVLKEIKANPFYVFSSIKAALEELINLTSNTAIPMLSQEQIGNLQIVLPPLEEQNEIADFLYLTKTRFNDAIIQCLDSITKLKEYRQSIISEAVTGKIDVRDWQPPVN